MVGRRCCAAHFNLGCGAPQPYLFDICVNRRNLRIEAGAGCGGAGAGVLISATKATLRFVVKWRMTANTYADSSLFALREAVGKLPWDDAQRDAQKMAQVVFCRHWLSS
jgi:hypothetical protein